MKPTKNPLKALDQTHAKVARDIISSLGPKNGKELAFLRDFYKIRQIDVAQYVGFTQGAISQIEKEHLGTDFRAPMGTPVLASNKGKVVLAEDLFFSGNTILIDHGLSLFTMYAHLSKIDCKVGDVVEKGALIGHSGNTGRVSGPHLHWGVKVNGSWVDGFTLPLN